MKHIASRINSRKAGRVVVIDSYTGCRIDVHRAAQKGRDSGIHPAVNTTPSQGMVSIAPLRSTATPETRLSTALIAATRLWRRMSIRARRASDAKGE